MESSSQGKSASLILLLDGRTVQTMRETLKNQLFRMRKYCQNFAEGHKTSQNLGSKVFLTVEKKQLSTWEAGLEWWHHQERIKRCLLGDLASERHSKNKNNVSGII